MKITPRRDDFAHMTNDRYSDAVCPLCEWGIHQGDDVALDQNGEACHAECVKKEEENGHSSIV